MSWKPYAAAGSRTSTRGGRTLVTSPRIARELQTASEALRDTASRGAGARTARPSQCATAVRETLADAHLAADQRLRPSNVGDALHVAVASVIRCLTVPHEVGKGLRLRWRAGAEVRNGIKEVNERLGYPVIEYPEPRDSTPAEGDDGLPSSAKEFSCVKRTRRARQPDLRRDEAHVPGGIPTMASPATKRPQVGQVHSTACKRNAAREQSSIPNGG